MCNSTRSPISPDFNSDYFLTTGQGEQRLLAWGWYVDRAQFMTSFRPLLLQGLLPVIIIPLVIINSLVDRLLINPLTVCFLHSFSLVTSLLPSLTQLLSYTFARNGEYILGMLLWLEITFMIYSAAKMQDQVRTMMVAYFCTVKFIWSYPW